MFILIVSIHAPARGATSCCCPPPACIERFNPRAREGRDQSSAPSTPHSASFQSTRPRGARPRLAMTSLSSLAFQSTRPRGARPRHLGFLVWVQAFQSTRPRGARHMDGVQVLAISEVSIHAPARGATWRPASRCCSRGFQSTRPRGARHALVDDDLLPGSFNPRAREGRDLRCGGVCRCRIVSIHAPARGATEQVI